MGTVPTRAKRFRVHVVDGTYELFRHFYGGGPSIEDESGRERGAVVGVVQSLIGMLEGGATHVGVATDHVIESFRNKLYEGYKTGEGIDPTLWQQFEPLEDAIAALGVVVWPMIEVEADDALAAAAAVAAADRRVQQVLICSPDKDLAQCVRGDRVVQVDRVAKKTRNEAGVREKFGVAPALIPDFLALVGDAADGYPGIAGIGRVGAARLLGRHGRIEDFPPETLGENRDRALLFKTLATLRTDADLFRNVEELRWRGPSEKFVAWAEGIGESRLAERSLRAAEDLTSG